MTALASVMCLLQDRVIIILYKCTVIVGVFMSLQQLIQQGQVWRGHRGRASPPVLASGYPLLDQRLVGGGWPRGALVEILCTALGSGELQLLQPLLAKTMSTTEWLLWATPPALPYAPALQRWCWPLHQQLWLTEKDPQAALWAVEQSLRSGCCRHVLAWLDAGPEPLSNSELRRLQLAAEQGQAQCWLFRHPAMLQHRSPAAIRIELASIPCGLRLTLHKRRGSWPLPPFDLLLSREGTSPQDKEA